MEKTELIEKIKTIRVEYNSFLNGWKIFIGATQWGSNQKAIYDTAINARSWWGKILGILDNPYPYSESIKPESKIIEPLADNSNVTFHIDDTNEVEVIKTQRVQVNDEIAKCMMLTDNLHHLDIGYSNKNIMTMHGLFNSLNNYSIALGLRLGEIREQSK